VADHPSTVLRTGLGLRSTSAANLLNYTAPESVGSSAIHRTSVGDESPHYKPEEIQSWAYEHLTEHQYAVVRDLRQAECDLRRRYLETTFTELILDLQEDLNDLQEAELRGDEDPDERTRLEGRIRKLKERKALRLAEFDLMMRLSADLPEIVTSAVVVPSPVAQLESDVAAPTRGVPMRRDDEVERIAMSVVMRYERSRGWTPFDVSQDGEHYDIRSESPVGELRFVEVKGRAQTGAIMLTGPEVDKLRQLGERAYLYIVTQCRGAQPRLRIIRDPMAQLAPEMLYRQVQWLVQDADWSRKGEDVGALL